jgi:hypothetical protein
MVGDGSGCVTSSLIDGFYEVVGAFLGSGFFLLSLA